MFDLPFQHFYARAVENNRTSHFGLWHRGISKYDQCRQEPYKFYLTVYLISDHQGQGQTESGKYAVKKCSTLRRNMTVQYLLFLATILSGSINKCWWTQLSVRPTEFKRASYMDKCISGIDSVPPANKRLCCSFTLNLAVVPYINWACTLHWPPTQFITNR